MLKIVPKLSPVPHALTPLFADGFAPNSKEKEFTKSDPLLAEIVGTCNIANMMEDLGYACCETPASFKELLAQFPELKEADVAQILGMLARTHSSLEGQGVTFYKDFPPTTDFTVSEKVEQPPKTWKIEVIIDVIRELYPKLNWPQVVKCLDYPGFNVPDPKGLALLMTVYRKASKDPFPLEYLFEIWKNTSGQLSFLKHAVAAPPDMFNIGSTLRRIDADGLPTVGKGALHQTWYSLSLIETLLKLAEVENYGVVRQTFNYPIKHCPELLCIGIAQATKVGWGNLAGELCGVLMHNILLSNNAASNFTIHKIWQHNPIMLIRGMVEVYSKDQSTLSRLLEIATQDLKALTAILDAKPFFYVIDLAALSSRREFLNLEKWLQDKIAENGLPFIKACFQHMRDRLLKNPKTESNQRLFDTLFIFYTCLQAIASTLPTDLLEELKAMGPKFQSFQKQKMHEDAFPAPVPVVTTPPLVHPVTPPIPATPIEVPQLDPKGTTPFMLPGSAMKASLPPGVGNPQNLGQPGLGQGPSGNPTGETRVFPPEVEEMANAYFQKIYTGQISIDEIVTLLIKFKNSKEKREQDIFACMIHNLFDEYRFFPKYPDKELQITGLLFGSLIQHQLVSFLPLGVALRYVLDALRKPPGSKMFKFGITALEQFKARLPEWPQYCSHILAIPPIHKFHPEIIEFIETHINSQPPGTAPANPPSGPGALTSTHPATPSPPLAHPSTTPPPGLGNINAPIHVAPVGVPPSAPEKEPPKPTPTTPVKKEEKKDSLPIDILLRNVTPPPTIDVAVMDKIAFVYNNVSVSNLDPKVGELKALLKDDDCIKYTAWYLICKRICLEFNFHSLYTAVLDKLKLPKLNNYLLSNTLEAINALLASGTITTSFEEKTLLKNLGSWLGLITLGKNKPLLQRDLGLKELLFEAYENGRLIVVIPFVCKVLETCANSKVFKPPNPWVMAIMRLLAEIYNKQNLRLSLKFEVELLCKALTIDMKELKPSDSLKDHNQYTGPGNLDFNPPPQPPPRAPSPVVEPPISLPLPPSQPDTPQPPIPDIPLNEPEHDEPFLDVLGNYLVISPAIPLFSQQPQLKRCVSVAVDRAIREIISPVVERSVTIATITTREMVLKDFAMEPDEQKMRKAAHLMVQNLAGSLALVTCKEPLRVSMNTHLRSLLQASTPEQYHPLVEQAVQMVSNDNLDLACTLIEKAATEKAVRDTDEALTTAFVARKKHRERGVAQPYYDINFTTGRYPSTLPESLRPKLGGLQPHQLRVFDDFSRIPHIQASQMGLSQAEDSRGPVDPSEALSTQQALEKLNLILNDMDNASLRNPIPLSSLPQDHEVFKLLQQVPIIINQSISRTEIAVAFAQKVFKTLFDSDVPLYQDVRFFILNSISELNPKIVKEITSWLFYFDDERKFHRHITPRLIITHLISVPDFDSQLAKLIETGRSKASLDFSVFIIKQGILEARYLSPNDLRETLELLSKLARAKGAEELMKLLEEVKTKALMGIVKQDDKPKKLSREASRDDSLAKPTLRTQIASDFSDPPGTKEEVIRIFDEWLAVYTQTIQTDSQNKLLLANHITQLQSHAIFKDDDSSSRFFRICTELAIENSFIPEKQAVSYVAVDAFSKLVVFLVKLSENPNTKIALLSRVLGVVVRVLIRDYDMKKSKFSQRSYFRLFANWLIDLNVPDPTLDPINLQILLAFSNAFMMMQPSRLPGFSFAWLEMVSHRMFMPKLLLTKTQKGWPLFQRLLTELFKFLEPYLRNAELSEPIRMLYKGTLRVLLVLLHDFPEFLCDYHFSFCDVIPPSCIQMRNLILSAFPRNMRLPDPFTPNLKVDLLPEINQSPRILSNYIPHLGQDLYNQVDNYLKNRSPVSFLLDLKSRLMLSNQEALATGTKYNVPVINALVLHVGIQAIAQLQNKSPNQLAPPIAQSAPMDIFQHLVVDLDTEGRYLLLNAIANQLRYPNNHTHYFSCVLLYLFAEATQEIIQEQITRVLLERLIVNRPHPWGLLITFIELIKNPRYSFWNHSFTRCAPEIERLFESVARSCMGPSSSKTEDQ